MVGQNEEFAAAMIITSLVSLAVQRSADHLELHIVNLTRTDTTHNSLIDRLASILP